MGKFHKNLGVLFAMFIFNSFTYFSFDILLASKYLFLNEKRDSS